MVLLIFIFHVLTGLNRGEFNKSHYITTTSTSLEIASIYRVNIITCFVKQFKFSNIFVTLITLASDINHNNLQYKIVFYYI